MIQEDMESNGNILANGDPIFSYIYTSSGRTKPNLCVDPCKSKISVILFMSTGSITNL